MNVCVYHNADLDGYCSAAIWKTEYPDGDLYGMNYGDKLDKERLIGKDVTVVDFTLEPWSEMMWLLDNAKSVTWIDHHKSSMDDWEKAGKPEINGIRKIGESACELCWRYYKNDELPRGVFLLGDYDAWRHSDNDTMPYQMGMRIYNLEPTSHLAMNVWKDLVFDHDEGFFNDVINAGSIIMAYKGQTDAVSAQRFAFKLSFEGKTWIAVNQGIINSDFFKSVIDSECDGMLGFVWAKDKWTVSLYSTKIDCSKIAKRHGGGGHPGASGFTCQTLPFDIG